MHPLRLAVLSLGLLGFALFLGAFALSYLDPLLVERGARELLRLEVERRAGERIDALSNSRLATLAERALAKRDVDLESARRALREELPAKVANVVADMLRADCECRKRLVEAEQAAQRERVASLAQLRERLAAFVEQTYATVSASLLREFRIVTGSNAAAFLLLAVTVLVRRRATLQLVLPAVVLGGAVVLAGGTYLFSQDWLHTIVFGQYVGFGYTIYLAAVAALLADILLNRARVTTEIVNAVLQLLRSPASAAPC